MPNFSRFRASILSFWDLLATAWRIIVICAIGFYIAFQFVEPAPPSIITMSVGPANSIYQVYASRYAEILKKNGITLQLETSEGSHENIQRLKSGGVDVAFVQGGIPAPVYFDGENEVQSNLNSLGSVAYEPVWVFHSENIKIDRLYHFSKRRIAVANQGSLFGMSSKLLNANGIRFGDANVREVAEEEIPSLFAQNAIDSAFIIAAPDSKIVQKLLKTDGVHLMNFSRAEAYLRLFPSLSKVSLPQGVIDLVKNIPQEDTTLLTTTSNVIAQGKLHPALANLLLQAMVEVHSKNGFFNRADEFPAYKDQSFPISEEAQHYYQSGPPFLQRFMPFWVAVLVDRLVVLIVPLLILFLPLLRFAPALYSWRVRSKIYRCYGDLRDLEDEVKEGVKKELKENFAAHNMFNYLTRLQKIEEAAFARHLPLAFTEHLYFLRQHIDLVRSRLTALQEKAEKSAQEIEHAAK